MCDIDFNIAVLNAHGELLLTRASALEKYHRKLDPDYFRDAPEVEIDK